MLSLCRMFREPQMLGLHRMFRALQMLGLHCMFRAPQMLSVRRMFRALRTRSRCRMFRMPGTRKVPQLTADLDNNFVAPVACSFDLRSLSIRIKMQPSAQCMS